MTVECAACNCVVHQGNFCSHCGEKLVPSPLPRHWVDDPRIGFDTENSWEFGESREDSICDEL